MARPISKKEKVTYLLATPIPFRFGNDSPVSVSFGFQVGRSDEHTSELKSQPDLVCRLSLEKNNI